LVIGYDSKCNSPWPIAERIQGGLLKDSRRIAEGFKEDC